jgi:hypothetical protein
MITIDHAGSRLYKWLFEFNGSLFFGWEPSEGEARAQAEWTLERLKKGEEVDLE